MFDYEALPAECSPITGDGQEIKGNNTQAMCEFGLISAAKNVNGTLEPLLRLVALSVFCALPEFAIAHQLVVHGERFVVLCVACMFWRMNLKALPRLFQSFFLRDRFVKGQFRP